MMSCLRTGDEESAHVCLQRLTERFGATNERLMALRGLFQEAVAADDAELKNVLKEYETILAQDPSNMVRLDKFCCNASIANLASPSRNAGSPFSSPLTRFRRPSVP